MQNDHLIFGLDKHAYIVKVYKCVEIDHTILKLGLHLGKRSEDLIGYTGIFNCICFLLFPLNWGLKDIFTLLLYWLKKIHNKKTESKRTPLMKVGVMGEIRTWRSMTHILYNIIPLSKYPYLASGIHLQKPMYFAYL